MNEKDMFIEKSVALDQIYKNKTNICKCVC